MVLVWLVVVSVICVRSDERPYGTSQLVDDCRAAMYFVAITRSKMLLATKLKTTWMDRYN